MSKNIFIVFQGFFLHEFIIVSGPTDFLALSFLVASWYYTCSVILKKRGWQHPAAAFLFFTLAALTRYQYMPACVAGAACLFYIGWKQKNFYYKQVSVFTTVFLIISIGVLLLWQKLSAGNFFYNPSPERGWYPRNLLVTYPFAISSFFNLDFWAQQLALLFNNSYNYWIWVFRLLKFPVLLLFLFSYWQWLKKKAPSILTASDNSWIIGGCIAVTTILFLIFLSLTNSPKLQTFQWTFVADGRYFAFPVLFLQLTIWHWAFQDRKFLKGLKKIIVLLLSVIFLIEGIHGFYFIIKKMSRPLTPVAETFFNDPYTKTMTNFIKEEKLKNPSRVIAVFSLNELFGYMANWNGVNGVFMINKMSNKMAKTTRPATLLVVLPHYLKDTFSLLIQNPATKIYKETSPYTFYTLQLEPGN